MKKRIVSIMMTAVMLMGNALPAVQVHAEETAAEAPPEYKVLIPQTGGLNTEYDKDHFDQKTDEGGVKLIYHENDEVKITITVDAEYELDKIQVVTDEEKDVPVEWASDATIRFFMPACNVKLQADLHMKPVETEQKQQEEDTAVIDAENESQQAEEQPPKAEDQEPEMQPEDSAVEDTNATVMMQEDPANGEASEDNSNDAAMPDDSSDDESQAPTDDTSKNSEENTDTNGDAAVGEDVKEEPPTPEITLSEDGFPTQGSIIRMSQILIPFEAESIEAESSFSEVNYPQDTVRVSMLSNEILYHVPGSYDVLYRADTSDNGRFWYLIRPVRVMEEEMSTEPETEGQDENDESGDEDEGSNEDTEDDYPFSDGEIDSETEKSDETEKVTGETAAYMVTTSLPDGILVEMNYKDAWFAGETVTFTVSAKDDLYISSIVAQLYSTLNSEENTQDDFLELTYNEGDQSYSFTMPDNDVCIIVTLSDGPSDDEAVIFEEETPLRAMLAAAANDDDEDEDWDDATEIETNKYYFTRKKGTYTLSSSLVNAQSNDHMKNVRYTVDGVTKKVQAFCIEPEKSAPPSNTTYTKYVDLDGGGDEKLLRKALFYMYGGPAFGDTISGINIKSVMTKGGCSTNADYYGITHYLMAYVYADTWGGHLSDKAKNLIKDIIADLKKLPDPGNVELTPLSGSGTYSASENVYKTGTFTYKGYAENTAMISLESGVTLHNTTRGTTGTGTVTINGGDSFYLTAAAGTGIQYSGKYSFTTKYPIDYHACALKFSGYQDIAFAYSTGGSINVKVDWPKEAIIDIVKMDATTRNTLAGAVYGLYSDASCTKLVSKFPATDANGAARVIIPVSQSTMYVKEIKAPDGYYRNQTVYPVSTVAGVTTKQEVTDERVKATIRLVKMDNETGRSPQGDATFKDASYGLYAREDIVHPDKKSGTLYHAGDLIATLHTDANGDASVSDLYLGKYYIKEVTPPVGYLIDEAEHDISCDYEGDTVAVVERSTESGEDVKKQSFQIIKAGNDGETTDAPLLSGTGFSVYLISSLAKNADGSYDFESAQPIVVNADGTRELFTDEKGYALSIPIPYGRYIVRETTSPHNFNPVDDFEITVTENRPNTPQVWKVLLDEQFKAKLKIIKKDDETKKNVLLPNTEFRIYDVENEKYVEQITTYPYTVRHTSYFTDNEGSLILPNSLKLGRYRIEEVQAPEGYAINTEYPVIEVDDNMAHMIESESQDVIIEAEYENHPVKGKLTVYKEGEMLSGYNGKEFSFTMQRLKGAVFEVIAAEEIYTPDHQVDADGNRTVIYHKGDKVSDITTGEDGMAILEDIPLGRYEVKQYGTFLGYCTTQKGNISKCIQNGWKIPELKNSDPEKLSSIVQEELKKRARHKYIRTRLIIALLLISVAAAFGLRRFHEYRASRVEIPFDAASAIGQDQQSIYEELKSAGFEKISLKEDNSGWLEGNKVTNVKIKDSDSFSKGTYIKPDEDVVITYSSAERVYVTDLLKSWKKSTYATIAKSLKEAGFSNISLEEVITTDNKQDQLVSKLLLNEEEYTNEACYLPSDAPIAISYYVFQVKIGNDNDHFIGKNYTKTVENLEKKGFTNVQTEEITDGFRKSKTVVEVTVDDKTSYQSEETFAPDTKIIVKYSSEGRVDLTSTLKDWASTEYTDLKSALSEKGFKSITTKFETTKNKSDNLHVSGILINDEKFVEGNCYVSKESKIKIKYYKLHIRLSQNAKELTKDKQYTEVVNTLQNKGFTNITLKRANDIGWFPIHDKEGSIKSISVNGNSKLIAGESFYFDAPIVIVVHTKKDSGCEDITIIDK